MKSSFLTALTLVSIGSSIIATNTLRASDEAESKILPAGAELELIADGFSFTEGPAVDPAGNVFFTDQPNDRIMRWSHDSGKVDEWLKPAGRSNGLFFHPDGTMLACADGSNQLWSIAPDKSHKVLLDGYEAKLFNGPNDVWLGPNDLIYFTDPFYKRNYWTRTTGPELPKRVYCLNTKTNNLTVAASDFVQPNGIVGDTTKRILYVADIGDKKTYRFRIDPMGRLVDKLEFCAMGSDGMTTDTEGNLYLTGRGVTVFNSAGEQIEQIAVPEKWTANICFGGVDRKSLFITASDSLYRIATKMKGL